MLCAALTANEIGGSQMAHNYKFSLPVCSQEKSPGAKQLSLQGTKCTSCLSSRSKFQFSASLQNYSNKPITSSSGNQGWTHPPDAPNLPPTASGSSFCSWVQPRCGPAWCAVLSPWLSAHVTVNCCQSHLSCPVSGVMWSAIPITLGQEISPLSTRWIGGDWNRLCTRIL